MAFSIPTRLTCLVCMTLVVGCAQQGGRITALPDKYEVDIGELQIRSDVDIDAGDPILEELKDLRQEIVKTLELPAPHRPVIVHLFADELRYSAYMTKAYPGLPPRRAFFIGSPLNLRSMRTGIPTSSKTYDMSIPTASCMLR